MPKLITLNSTVQCPHGGTAVLTTTNAEAKADGAYILLVSDVHVISGCPFIDVTPAQVGGPCLTLLWQNGTMIAKHRTGPFVSMASVGLCFNAKQIPQGPAVLSNPSSADAL